MHNAEKSKTSFQNLCDGLVAALKPLCGEAGLQDVGLHELIIVFCNKVLEILDSEVALRHGSSLAHSADTTGLLYWLASACTHLAETVQPPRRRRGFPSQQEQQQQQQLDPAVLPGLVSLCQQLLELWLALYSVACDEAKMPGGALMGGLAQWLDGSGGLQGTFCPDDCTSARSPAAPSAAQLAFEDSYLPAGQLALALLHLLKSAAGAGLGTANNSSSSSSQSAMHTVYCVADVLSSTFYVSVVVPAGIQYLEDPRPQLQQRPGLLQLLDSWQRGRQLQQLQIIQLAVTVQSMHQRQQGRPYDPLDMAGSKAQPAAAAAGSGSSMQQQQLVPSHHAAALAAAGLPGYDCSSHPDGNHRSLPLDADCMLESMEFAIQCETHSSLQERGCLVPDHLAQPLLLLLVELMLLQPNLSIAEQCLGLFGQVMDDNFTMRSRFESDAEQAAAYLELMLLQAGPAVLQTVTAAERELVLEGQVEDGLGWQMELYEEVMGRLGKLLARSISSAAAAPAKPADLPLSFLKDPTTSCNVLEAALRATAAAAAAAAPHRPEIIRQDVSNTVDTANMALCIHNLLSSRPQGKGKQPKGQLDPTAAELAALAAQQQQQQSVVVSLLLSQVKCLGGKWAPFKAKAISAGSSLCLAHSIAVNIASKNSSDADDCQDDCSDDDLNTQRDISSSAGSSSSDSGAGFDASIKPWLLVMVRSLQLAAACLTETLSKPQQRTNASRGQFEWESVSGSLARMCYAPMQWLGLLLEEQAGNGSAAAAAAAGAGAGLEGTVLQQLLQKHCAAFTSMLSAAPAVERMHYEQQQRNGYRRTASGSSGSIIAAQESLSAVSDWWEQQVYCWWTKQQQQQQKGASRAAVAEWAQQLQTFAAALCAELPVLYCCNNPNCGIIDSMREVQPAGAKSSKCAGCKSVAYCSRHCQKAHWPLHKTVCKRLQQQQQQQQ